MACFAFVLFWLEIFGEKGKNASFCSSPTPLRLGEGVLAYANPRPISDPCLLRLGEGMLHLGKENCSCLFSTYFAFYFYVINTSMKSSETHIIVGMLKTG